jgi:hypothetical protein
LWDKTYIDIPKTKHHTVVISIRPLTKGEIGLNWGTQDLNEVAGTASMKSLHIERLHLGICNGSAGFAGGFVMTRSLCVPLSLTDGPRTTSRQVEFGNEGCPR